MALHPLVAQLYFTRSEFRRIIQGISKKDAERRLEPMNSISWMVGHLANQESRWWVLLAQGRELMPELNERVGYEKPATTPPLAEMLAAWEVTTQAANQYLETVTSGMLLEHFLWNGKPRPESIGTTLHRCIYHYWYHTGEASAVRQLLGHTDLPQFIGEMSAAAYRREEPYY
jgi:uncharacterized damage-inducible protein DinB